MNTRWGKLSERIEPLQFPSWTFLAFQIAIALGCLWFWFCTPAPGWAIAIVAFAAASMSIQNDMKGWQKAIWMILIGILLVIELRAITKDRTESNARFMQARKDQDAAFQGIRKTENSNFKVTAKRLETAIATSQTMITQSQQQFSTTAAKLNQNLHILDRTLDQTKPRAYVEFIRFEFLQSPQDTWGGRDFSFRAWFMNNGNDSANELWKLGKFYIASPDEEGAKAAYDSFHADWINNKKGPSFLARAEERFEVDTQNGFGVSRMNQVFAHQKVLYFFFRAEYSDKTGKWGSLSCREIFNPLTPDEIHCPNIGTTLFNEPHFKINQR